jgi:peroxiredoxin
MKFKLLTFLFLICGFLSFSQTIVISGTAEALKGNEIGLFIYEDYISLKEKLIAETKIDQSGKFSLSANISGTSKVFLRSDNVASNFYVEPGKSYSVVIPPVAPGKEILGNINYVPLKINNQSAGDINSLIAGFNNKFDNFVQENYNQIIRKSAKKQIEEFKAKMRKDYAAVKDPFFKDFLNYSLATLEQLAQYPKNKLYKQYLHSAPINHRNPEYMAFFNDFYENYFLLIAQSNKGAEIPEAINKYRNYQKLLTILSQDSLLQNPEIRELILIKGLKENYHNEDFDKTSIQAVLKYIITSSEFENNRKIAANVINKLSRFEEGATAPEFKLSDISGKTVSLSDFKGKYIFINFYANWCSSCVQEMSVMRKLHEKYGDKIVFISISTDKSKNDFAAFAKKNQFPWTFLHYENQKTVLEQYDSRSLPGYFLISPDGRFVKAHAEVPSLIEKRFHEITKVPEKKYKVGEK